MRGAAILVVLVLFGGCDRAPKPKDSTTAPTTVKSGLDEAREAASDLPRVELECPLGDDPRGIAFDEDNGGLPAAEDVVGLAVQDRSELPAGDFRRSAGTDKAAQFVFPASGPPQAVVVATKADAGWRAHRLEGCKSLTLLRGEGD